MGLIIGGVPPHDLILDGQSVSLYAGGNPPTKVWPTREKVQITLGTEYEARDQLQAALAERGLNYKTVTEIPFGIELVGSGSAREMFADCFSLTHAPDMDTSQVTSMRSMFYDCKALTYVPDMNTSRVTTMRTMFQDCKALTSVPAMDTSQVTSMYYMLRGCLSLTYVPDMDTSQVTRMEYMLFRCSSLTDGNVRLVGKHPNVRTTNLIAQSGLTRLPFYDTNGNPI